MREFIRHSSNIPLVIKQDGDAITERQTLKNVSPGGLSCLSSGFIDEGFEVTLRIEHVDPVFEIKGKVKWCKPNGDVYDLGVEFHTGEDSAYRLRMVEQICHIEQYRNDIMQTEGRSLTSEQAAGEWIKKYASTFP